MIVDAHHHLWDISHGYAWLDAPELSPIRRSFDTGDLSTVTAGSAVSHTVLVEAGRGDAAEAYEFLNIAADSPLISGVVAWADITDPDLAHTVSQYRTARGGNKLVGIRSQVQGEPDDDYLRRPDVHHGLAALATAGLAFDLVLRMGQLPAAATAARAVPDVRLVLDHLGKPPISRGELSVWREALKRVAAQPNVAAKLSGLVTEADWTRWTPSDLRPYIHTALELFGPERLMFGSDWPVCLLAADYQQVVAAITQNIDDLTPAEQAAIWAGTAIRTYHLSPHNPSPASE